MTRTGHTGNEKVRHGRGYMSERIIDTVSRRAADAASRRASLLALGGMALAAVAAAPSAASAGKKRKKRKKRGGGNGNAIGPLAQARCASQVDQCRTSITALCEGNADCLALLSCCNSFVTCDAVGALRCIFRAD
jgi:hypothetical protein